MTNRANQITVVLENDIRHDDLEVLLSAIRQFRGIIAAEPNVVNPDSWMAEERARNHFRQRLWDALKDD